MKNRKVLVIDRCDDCYHSGNGTCYGRSKRGRDISTKRWAGAVPDWCPLSKFEVRIGGTISQFPRTVFWRG